MEFFIFVIRIWHLGLFYTYGTIMSIDVYIYIYIYIYMHVYVYMYVCESVCVCVRRWVAKEGILSSVSLTGVWGSGGRPLCLLWREDYIKSCARENVRDRKRRMKRVSQWEVRLRSDQLGGDSDAEGQTFRVGSGAPKQRSSQSGAEKQSVRSEGSDISELKV